VQVIPITGPQASKTIVLALVLPEPTLVQDDVMSDFVTNVPRR